MFKSLLITVLQNIFLNFETHSTRRRRLHDYVVSMSKLENSTIFTAGSDDTAPGAGTSTLLEIGS